MTDKTLPSTQRYNLTIPIDIAGKLEDIAASKGLTPTAYAGLVVREHCLNYEKSEAIKLALLGIAEISKGTEGADE